jgi:endonuclease III
MAQEKIGTKKKAEFFFKVLSKNYPDAKCSLEYADPFQLLISTVLSAQCTDQRVNFKRFPNAAQMAQASLPELETLIRSTGFFRTKSLSLLAIARAIIETHHGRVPNSMEALIKIRGIGRKTANVVLGNYFQKPSLVVDTHVGRLSRRMGLTNGLAPEKVEQDLMKLFKKKHWTVLSHLFIAHGRAICTARRAHCTRCSLSTHCPKIGIQN